jgi:hypothetical protein
VSAGDWALIILAIFWAVLVAFLALVCVSLFKVLGATHGMLDGIREQTVPLLGDVRSTVSSVNRNLEESERLVASAANITTHVERLTQLVDMALSTPLIKVISASYGTQAALRRFRGQP